MARPHGSVRIGPMSLLTLIIILCLAVLAVLSFTTARAELSITQRQATTTTDTYELEYVAQEFMAALDDQLAGVRDASGGAKQAYAAADQAMKSYGLEVAASDAAASADAVQIQDDTVSGAPAAEEAGVQITRSGSEEAAPITMNATREGGKVSATFETENGRLLSIGVLINDDATFTITDWKVTTQWIDNTGENLWMG